jgi:uncharacterized protein YbjT (DUF2867 family)
VILLTGATGVIGSALLQKLLDSGQDVRCLVRDPRRLGPNRVRVQITLGGLADPVALRQAVRGVSDVVHLAAAIRDQPGASIEELNAMATIRLLRDAERAGVERFVYFSAMGAKAISATRFFRAKALAEQAVLASRVEGIVFAPSLVYAPGDPWLTLLGRLAHLPWMPISGSGSTHFQPIWAEDVASCVEQALTPSAQRNGDRFEIAGPETLTYEEIVRLALEAEGHRRPLVHVPLGLVRLALGVLERLAGSSTFATWEEAELLEEAMTTEHGPQDVRRFGVDPKPMREVLGLAGGTTP